MSDRMTPMPFAQLMQWMMKERERTGSIFGVYRPYKAKAQYDRTLFGRKLETPVGPAAGPHTQLAQNIAAAYYSGGRFFELKTVQIIDGEDLPVSKPCILADDECYNCEWSTAVSYTHLEWRRSCRPWSSALPACLPAPRTVRSGCPAGR